jgi:hypothetical protein
MSINVNLPAFTIKLFTAVICRFSFSQSTSVCPWFQPCQMFAAKALPTEISLERLTKDKHSSLLQKSSNSAMKSLKVKTLGWYLKPFFFFVTCKLAPKKLKCKKQA